MTAASDILAGTPPYRARGPALAITGMSANRHHPARAHNRGNSEPKRRQDKQFMAGKLTSRTWVLLTEAPGGGWPARRRMTQLAAPETPNESRQRR
jgi:hypothetical protein